jgi:signal transduction histidine kinase
MPIATPATHPIAEPTSVPWRTLREHALVAALFNSVLAGVIATFGMHGFMQNLLYSQLIGMSIWALIDVGRYFLFPGGWGAHGPMALLVTASTLTGYLGGSAVGDMLMGFTPLHGMVRSPKAMAGFLLMSLACGVLGTFYFMGHEKLQRAQLEREEALRQATTAQLTLLQSQLEPHMLFNTLANLRALINTDPERATHMLDRLNDYLRSTLTASRASEHALGAEFDRLRDYLELIAIRMGPRLAYTLDLPAELAAQPVPPLILQSLVENAIIHGLEPQVEGGQVVVSARADGNTLVLQVVDTGAGVGKDVSEGFGITQVRERLASRYGSLASINLIANYSISTSEKCPKNFQNTPIEDENSLQLSTPQATDAAGITTSTATATATAAVLRLPLAAAVPASLAPC